MASLRKKARTWFACITLADGTRTQRSTCKKDIGTPAERAEARRQALQVAQLFEEQARGNSTEAQVRKTVADFFRRTTGRHLEFARVDAFLADYLKRVKLHKAPATYVRYENVTRHFLLSLGAKAQRSLGDVTPLDVQTFLDAQLAEGRRPTSVKLNVKVLSTPFNHALRQGLIVSNPVLAAVVPDGVHESRSPFTWAQVQAILLETSGDWKTATLLGAYTGARLGDCANMAWSNVDLAAKVLRFRPAKTQRKGKDLVLPLHPSLEAHLLKMGGVDRAEAFLCPSLAGQPIGGRKGLSRQFQDIVGRAAIDNIESPARLASSPENTAPSALEHSAEPGDPQRVSSHTGHPLPPSATAAATKGHMVRRYGFHSLRHTFNTELANEGVDQETRMAMNRAKW